MLIKREVAGGNGERSEPYAAGGLGKILRFGALRAVLRHYSRIINKTFLLNSFIFSPTKTYLHTFLMQFYVIHTINIYVFVSDQDQSVDQSEFLRYIFEDMDMENNTVILSSTQTINISTCHKWINTWMKDSICSWGFGGRCKPPQKILRFGALRAVLRHYSRIINKTDTKCCFLHFGRGVQDPLSGDQGGVLGPLDPPPLDPPQDVVGTLDIRTLYRTNSIDSELVSSTLPSQIYFVETLLQRCCNVCPKRVHCNIPKICQRFN